MLTHELYEKRRQEAMDRGQPLKEYTAVIIHHDGGMLDTAELCNMTCIYHVEAENLGAVFGAVREAMWNYMQSVGSDAEEVGQFYVAAVVEGDGRELHIDVEGDPEYAARQLELWKQTGTPVPKDFERDAIVEIVWDKWWSQEEKAPFHDLATAGKSEEADRDVAQVRDRLGLICTVASCMEVLKKWSVELVQEYGDTLFGTKEV